MRHVHHQQRADLVADFAEGAEVDDARIGRAAGDDHFRLVLARQPRDLLHVDALVVAAHAVGHRLEPFARHVDRRAVGQMPAGGEIEPHEGVAGLHQSKKNLRVSRSPRMRLYIRKFAAEQLCYPLNGQLLGHVDELAAAVVALARQAFGVFVGENRALRFQNGARNDVLRGDQLDLVALAAEFLPNNLGDLRIDLCQRRREQGFHVACRFRTRRRRHHDLLAPGRAGAELRATSGISLEIAYRPPPAKHWHVDGARTAISRV